MQYNTYILVRAIGPFAEDQRLRQIVFPQGLYLRHLIKGYYSILWLVFLFMNHVPKILQSSIFTGQFPWYNLRLMDPCTRCELAHKIWLLAIFYFIEFRSSLFYQICAHQFEDPKLCLIHEKVLRGEAKATIINSDNVLRVNSRVCVPKVWD